MKKTKKKTLYRYFRVFTTIKEQIESKAQDFNSSFIPKDNLCGVHYF